MKQLQIIIRPVIFIILCTLLISCDSSFGTDFIEAKEATSFGDNFSNENGPVITPIEVAAGAITGDGVRDAVYGYDSTNVLFDPSEDGANIYTGTDFANIAFAVDGTYLWIYTSFMDLPISQAYGMSSTMMRAYMFGFNHSEINFYSAVMIYYTGSAWATSNNITYTNPLEDFLAGSTIFISESDGIEIRVNLAYLRAAASTYNFWLSMGDDQAALMANDDARCTLIIQ